MAFELFVNGTLMRGLALAPPKKIQQAVPANLVCGRETQALRG